MDRFARLETDRQNAMTATALAELLKSDRDSAVALVLVEYEGVRVTDVAEAMGVKKGTVTKRVSRAKKFIRRYVASEMASSSAETNKPMDEMRPMLVNGRVGGVILS